MKFLSFLIHIPLLIFIAFWLKRKCNNHVFGKYFLPLLFLKVLTGIVLAWIYVKNYEYPTDLVYYHSDARELYSLFIKDPLGYFQFIFTGEYHAMPSLYFQLQPRALLFVKLISPIEIICLANGWLVSAYLSLLSFVSSWFLFQKLSNRFPAMKNSFMIAILVFPSVVFWSSGLMKETVIVPCIYLLIVLVIDIRFNVNIKWWRYALLIPCLYILLIIKYYVFAVLVPLLLAYMISEKLLKSYSQMKRLIIGVFLLLVFIIGASLIHPNLNINNVLTSILINHDKSVAASELGTYADFGLNINSSFGDVISTTPNALIAGLYRPMIGEGRNVLSLIAGIENLILALMTILALYSKFKYKIEVKNEAFYILLYSILLATLLAIASPNLGTLVRYKVMFLPLLLCVLIYPCQVFLQNTIFRKK